MTSSNWAEKFNSVVKGEQPQEGVPKCKKRLILFKNYEANEHFTPKKEGNVYRQNAFQSAKAQREAKAHR